MPCANETSQNNTDTITLHGGNKYINQTTPDRPTKSVEPNAPKRPKKLRDWWGKKGMCEVCSLRQATVNLELEYGSHRECQICWDD